MQSFVVGQLFGEPLQVFQFFVVAVLPGVAFYEEAQNVSVVWLQYFRKFEYLTSR